MATLQQLEQAMLIADRMGDQQSALKMAQEIQRIRTPQPAAPADIGGFTPALKTGGALVAESFARPLEEAGIQTGIPAFAEGVYQQNPLTFSSVGAFRDQPVTAIKEILGQQAAPLTATMLSAAVGRALGARLGPTGQKIGEEVFAFLPNLAIQYQEARARQEQEGVEDSRLKALAAAAAGAGLETMGLERIARKAAFGGGSAGRRLTNALKAGVTAAPIEAGTEAAQQALTRFAAGQSLTTPEAVSEYQTGALGGAVGGGVLGGAIGAAQRPAPKAAEKSKTPEPEEEETDVDPEVILSETTVRQAPPKAQETREEAPQEAEVDPRLAELDLLIDDLRARGDEQGAAVLRQQRDLIAAEGLEVGGAEAVTLETPPDPEAPAVPTTGIKVGQGKSADRAKFDPPLPEVTEPQAEQVTLETPLPAEQYGFITGRATPQGRAPFVTREDAIAYRREIRGENEYDVLERDDGIVLAPRTQEEVLATYPTALAAKNFRNRRFPEAEVKRNPAGQWEVINAPRTIPPVQTEPAQELTPAETTQPMEVTGRQIPRREITIPPVAEPAIEPEQVAAPVSQEIQTAQEPSESIPQDTQTEITDAIQEPAAAEGVLRQEGPELGLQKMGEGVAQETAAQSETQREVTDRPLAAKGLNSYRYRGRYGWIMIGAKNDADALNEARRSIDDQRTPPVMENLEAWDGEKYAPVSATDTTETSVTVTNEGIAGTWRHTRLPDATVEVEQTDKGYRIQWSPDDVQEIKGKTARDKATKALQKEGYERGVMQSRESMRADSRTNPEKYDPSPEESAEVMAAIKGKRPAEVARWLAQTSEGWRREIATKAADRLEAIAKQGVPQRLYIVESGQQAPDPMGEMRAKTQLTAGANPKIEIYINGSSVTGKIGTSRDVVLHEIVHAATMGAIWAGRKKQTPALMKAAEDLDALTAAVKGHFQSRVDGGAELSEFESYIKDGRINALEDNAEVLAWSLSVPEMQDYLESIPYQGGNAWTKFVSLIRELIGLPASADSALSEVLRISEVMLSEEVRLVRGIASQAIGATTQSPVNTMMTAFPRAPAPMDTFGIPDWTDKSAARREAVREFGEEGIANLDRQGILKFMTSTELPDSLRSQIDDQTTGLFDQKTQTAYILTDRGGDVKKLLLHELGEHFGLRGMLGADLHNNVLNDVRRMIESSTDTKFNAALTHVRENYALDETSNVFAKEVIARYAEDPGNAPWWGRLLSEVRQFLFKLGITKELKEADLAYLVQKALRKTMRGEIQKYDADGEAMQSGGNKFPPAADIVDGRTVRGEVPNMASIGASMTDYDVLRGVREVSMADMDQEYVNSVRSSRLDARTQELADAISESNEINPLIVAVDSEGPYILEGAHRFDALIKLGAKSFPAVVVIEKDGVMQRRGPDSPLPEQSRFQKVQRVLQDKFNRWTQAQEYIEKASGGKLKFTENVVEKAALFPGRVQADYEMVSKKYIDPIIKSLKQNNITLETFDKFNRAMHAPERNAAIFKINPEADPSTNPGAGMLDAQTKATDDNSRRYIASLSENERQILTQANKKLVGLNKWRLTRQLEAGLISQGEFDVLTKKYQHYVPLKTIDDGDEITDGTGAAGFMVRGKEWKQALGRASEATSPFTVSVMDVTRSIMRTEKQEVGKAMLALARNPAASSIMRVLDPESIAEEFRIKKTYKVKGPEGTKEVVRYGIDPSYPSYENVIVVKEGGKPVYVLVNDSLLAQQFKNLREEQLTGAMEVMNRLTTGLGGLFTRYNPAFVPINFARDLLTVTINSLGVPGLNPGKIFAGTFEGMPAIFSTNFGDGTGYLTDEYKQFLNDGATIGGLGLKDLNALQREMREKGLSLKGEQTGYRQVYGNLKQALEMVSRTNEIVENGTRFSVYRNARETFYGQNIAKGMKPDEAMGDARQRAAVLAREISVDFNKRGEYSRAFNSMYIFFNAAVQGLRSFGKFSLLSPQANRVQMALLGLLGAGVATRLFNHAVGGWDDDLEQPTAIAFEQQAQISAPLIMGDRILKVPLPYVFNIPFALGYRLTDAMLTGRIGHNVGEIVKTTYGALSPLGEPERAASVFGAAVKFVTPSVFSPVADIVDNTNRFGGPVYKEPPLWDKAPPPMSHNHFNSASETSQAITQLLNILSGGTETKPGAVNLSPDMLDHIAEYYSGGPGRFLMQGWDLITKGTDPLDAPPPSKYPILGRVWAEAKPDWYPSIEFRKMQKKMAYIDKAIEAGEKVTPEERKVNSQYNSANKQLEQLYRQIRVARNRKDEAAEKRLDERIYKIKERAVKQYNVGFGLYAEAMKGTPRKEAAAMFKDAGKDAMAGLLENPR